MVSTIMNGNYGGKKENSDREVIWPPTNNAATKAVKGYKFERDGQLNFRSCGFGKD